MRLQILAVRNSAVFLLGNVMVFICSIEVPAARPVRLPIKITIYKKEY